MPTRITPLDIQALSDPKEYSQGMKFYERGKVKSRFRSDTSLIATVKADENCRVEVMVDGEQIFGRCTCSPESSNMCRHQVAVALAFLEKPTTFIPYEKLRKAIKKTDKSSLVEMILHITNVIPELASFFNIDLDDREIDRLKRQIADIFDLQLSGHWQITDITIPASLMLQRANMYRNAGYWEESRIICYELLENALAFDDKKHCAAGYPENFIPMLTDAYEGTAMNDPQLESKRQMVLTEINKLSEYESAEVEGVYMDQLIERLEEE